MTEGPLIALMHGSLIAQGRIDAAATGVDRSAAHALVDAMRERIARAEAGPGSDGRETTVHPGTGADLRIHGFHYPGPRGGSAAIVRIVAPPAWDGGPVETLTLARRALDALLAPAWTRADGDRARAVAMACAVAASRAAPSAQLWLGDAGGPLGGPRADALPPGNGRLWTGTDGLDGLSPVPSLPSLTVAIDRPRDHGRTPPAITLEPAWYRMTRQGLAAIDPVAMLRLSALTPPEGG